jgi:hypothetical protein
MANCNLLLTSGDQLLQTNNTDLMTLTEDCTAAVIPIRRIYRTDSGRPEAPRGRYATDWGN